MGGSGRTTGRGAFNHVIDERRGLDRRRCTDLGNWQSETGEPLPVTAAKRPMIRCAHLPQRTRVPAPLIVTPVGGLARAPVRKPPQGGRKPKARPHQMARSRSEPHPPLDKNETSDVLLRHVGLPVPRRRRSWRAHRKINEGALSAAGRSAASAGPAASVAALWASELRQESALRLDGRRARSSPNPLTVAGGPADGQRADRVEPVSSSSVCCAA